MKRFKFLKGFFLMLTLVLTFALIPDNIAYAGPTCCDNPRLTWERRGDSHTDKSDHTFGCKAGHGVVHYCNVTKKYGTYWKVCKNCHSYWESQTRLESTNHSVSMACHP